MNPLSKIVVHVCIPHTRRDYFDYDPKSFDCIVGTRVWVPFGQKKKLGIIIGHGLVVNPHFEIKSLIEIIDDQPLLSEHLLKLCHWVSQYYHAPLSEVLPLALPKHFREGRPVCSFLEYDYQLAILPGEAHAAISQRAKRQHDLIDFLTLNSSLSKQQMLAAGFNSQQIESLLSQQILKLIPRTLYNGNQPQSKPLSLNAEQDEAVKRICQSLNGYQCFLIDGITGSGKTEVYLQVIAQVLAMGKQVLILVPEIGLTPQLLSRFTHRFSEVMGVMHSNLNDTERQKAWQLSHESTIKLIIGTRGAVFTPMPDLGLIVIDEEHDSSLKQIERVRYSARDTALMRAYMANIPIILGSATPSLESLHNCTLKKYTLLKLTEKAASQEPLRYQLLDIRNEILHEGLAVQSLQLIREHLAQQEQVLVFINRRGFSPVLLCHQCGWMADCRACDAHLTVHRKSQQLACHHCGLIQPIPKSCSKCASKDLVPVGVGTQRIFEYLSIQFPQTNILRIDRDEMGRKEALNNSLKKINEGKAQLIVGTQMLAKGHHFPKLTLVVVIDTDNGFYNQDFRATERLGQLLIQVAGRAGREALPGHVVIQTHLPQHPLLNLLVQQGYAAFAQALIAQRQQALMPPYSHLALLRAQSKTMPKVLSFLHTIKQHLTTTGIDVLGPAPAPLARKANHYRMQLLLKSHSRAQRESALHTLKKTISQSKLDKSIEWTIDVDPIDLS